MEAEVRTGRPQAKECGQLLGAGKGKEWCGPLEPAERMQLYPTPWVDSLRPILDVRPPEL